MSYFRSINSMCQQQNHKLCCMSSCKDSCRTEENPNFNCILRQFWEVLKNFEPCQSDYLPILYWYTVFVGVYNLVKVF